jgi:hypothetical protein
MFRALPLAVLALFATAPLRTAAQSLPDWIYATPGTHAWLGADEGDAPTATVCPTAAAYAAFAKSYAPGKGCTARKEGTAVVVDATLPGGPACDQRTAVVRVHAADGSWHGYTGIGSVEPAIPAGALLAMHPANGQAATIAASRNADSTAGIDLGSSTTVKVVKFAVDSSERDLLVTVVSGPNAGKRGWTYAVQAAAHGAPANVLLCPPGAKN